MIFKEGLDAIWGQLVFKRNKPTLLPRCSSGPVWSWVPRGQSISIKGIKSLEHMEVWSRASECPRLQQPESRQWAPEVLDFVFWANVKVTTVRKESKRKNGCLSRGSYWQFGAESLLCAGGAAQYSTLSIIWSDSRPKLTGQPTQIQPKTRPTPLWATSG